MGKRSHGGQKKRYKDNLKASLKAFNIPAESWEQIAQDQKTHHHFGPVQAYIINSYSL